MKSTGFSRYAGITFLIGAGFFTMGLMDPLYDTYVPTFLGRHLSSMALVGILMTLDNILAIVLIPVVTVWSDGTRSRLGRRMPFILVTLPFSALFFSLLPYAAPSLLAILLVLFLLNIFKQAARGPVVALMPDVIPGSYRSEANGVINTMGGIAAIVGTIGLARLMDLDATLPLLGSTKGRLPFPVAGLLVVIALALLVGVIRENRLSAASGNAPKEQPTPFPAALREAARRGGSSLLVLVALFLWFLAYQGVLPFIGKYAIETIGTSSGGAALGAGAVAIAYATFAIPSGYLAHRFGRRRIIRISLAVLVAVSLALFAFDAVLRGGALPRAAALPIYLAILFIFGVFWSAVVTNSFPMLWQMATPETMGIYTGLYYTFSQLAAVLAPPIAGGIIDLIRIGSAGGSRLADIPASVGYPGMFLFCAAGMLAAFFVMRFVRHGEPGDEKAA